MGEAEAIESVRGGTNNEVRAGGSFQMQGSTPTPRRPAGRRGGGRRPGGRGVRGRGSRLRGRGSGLRGRGSGLRGRGSGLRGRGPGLREDIQIPLEEVGLGEGEERRRISSTEVSPVVTNTSPGAQSSSWAVHENEAAGTSSTTQPPIINFLSRRGGGDWRVRETSRIRKRTRISFLDESDEDSGNSNNNISDSEEVVNEDGEGDGEGDKDWSP